MALLSGCGIYSRAPCGVSCGASRASMPIRFDMLAGEMGFPATSPPELSATIVLCSMSPAIEAEKLWTAPEGGEPSCNWLPVIVLFKQIDDTINGYRAAVLGRDVFR